MKKLLLAVTAMAGLACLSEKASAQAMATFEWIVTNASSTQTIVQVLPPTNNGFEGLSMFPTVNIGPGGVSMGSGTTSTSFANAFVFFGEFVGSPFNRDVYCSFSLEAGTINSDGTTTAPSQTSVSIGGETTTRPICKGSVSSNPMNQTSSNSWVGNFIFNWQ
jgi:hypothetical protein